MVSIVKSAFVVTSNNINLCHNKQVKGVLPSNLCLVTQKTCLQFKKNTCSVPIVQSITFINSYNKLAAISFLVFITFVLTHWNHSSFTRTIRFSETINTYVIDLHAANQHFLTYPNVHHAKPYFVGKVCLQFFHAGGAKC